MRITVAQSARELLALRPLWEALSRQDNCTVFQTFEWNLIAARFFGGREVPYVVAAQSSCGEAIVPAVRISGNGTLSLLGETLFDYRKMLWRGDDAALRAAVGKLAELDAPFSCSHLIHELFGRVRSVEMCLAAKAPCVRREIGFRAHSRLARNLDRLSRIGARVECHLGHSAQPLLKYVYEQKAKQPLGALFGDTLRIAAICAMAFAAAECCEIFTLETETTLVAALVTFLDGSWRRFYTVYFNPAWARYSPGLTLIHHVCEKSLKQGLDCDLMTGEQPYKLRLANDSVPIYRLKVTADALAHLALPDVQYEAA